ncbi:MAG: hypothetical protein ABUL73_03180 [Alphaproteobacteria bacterium]
MHRLRRILLCGVALAFACPGVISAQTPARTPDAALSAEIVADVATIRSIASPEARGDAAHDLAHRIGQMSKAEVDGVSPDAIDAVAALLRDDATALSACHILSRFGTHARSAVSVLEAAIERELAEERHVIFISGPDRLGIMRRTLRIVRGGDLDAKSPEPH